MTSHACAAALTENDEGTKVFPDSGTEILAQPEYQMPKDASQAGLSPEFTLGYLAANLDNFGTLVAQHSRMVTSFSSSSYLLFKFFF